MHLSTCKPPTPVSLAPLLPHGIGVEIHSRKHLAVPRRVVLCTAQPNTGSCPAQLRQCRHLCPAQFRCGHCKHLTPEYKALGELVEADPELKARVTIAKVGPWCMDVIGCAWRLHDGSCMALHGAPWRALVRMRLACTGSRCTHVLERAQPCACLPKNDCKRLCNACMSCCTCTDASACLLVRTCVYMAACANPRPPQPHELFHHLTTGQRR